MKVYVQVCTYYDGSHARSKTKKKQKKTLHTIKVREKCQAIRRSREIGRNARERERMKGGVTQFLYLIASTLIECFARCYV